MALYRAKKSGAGEILGTLQEIAKATDTQPDIIVYKSKQPRSVLKYYDYKAWQFEAVEPLEQWQLELLQLYGNTVVGEQRIKLFGKEEIERMCLDNGIQAKVNAVEDALGTTYLLETKEAEARRIEKGDLSTYKRPEWARD